VRNFHLTPYGVVVIIEKVSMYNFLLLIFPLTFRGGRIFTLGLNSASACEYFVLESNYTYISKEHSRK
jgi:hypothetical protein